MKKEYNNSEMPSDMNPIESIREGYKLEYDDETRQYTVINPVGEFIGKFNSSDIKNAVEEDFNKRFDDAFGTGDIVFDETDDDSLMDDFLDSLIEFR